jgi:diaminohydroxyphosphoribosylaminopyrimidine deaminase / 5-amino-6-(5-phosphoribosylamino)uracil reductase
MLTRENLLFLQRCFDIGRLGTMASPNPSVGSVIVAPDGRIIGEGYTQPYGGAHAEVMAVASVKPIDRPILPLSTIFVSLEPCAHTGKTKPCVDLILREKLSKVVIAHLDPNPLVCEISVAKLRENNVEVQIFKSNKSSIRRNTEGSFFLNEKHLENGQMTTLLPFFTNITQKRPFIILKWAESADGFIGIENRHVNISNNYSKKLVHKWRSEIDAIMVGTTTAERDNPELTNRFYFGKSPIRVVLDRNTRLSPDLKIFDGTVKTLVFSEKKVKKAVYTEGSFEKSNSENLESDNLIRHFVDFDENVLSQILTVLHSEKIGILFIEGGEKLLSSFIELGLWDEARVFTSSKTLGEGIQAPQLSNATLRQTHQIDDDLLHIYIREAV